MKSMNQAITIIQAVREYRSENVKNDLTPERVYKQNIDQESAANSLDMKTAPKYPKYATKTARVGSYSEWPDTASHTPEVLADAGFFYQGFGDRVRCFHCGMGLCQWAKEDDPWIEHARWAGNCVFVKQKKGEEFVNLVQMAVQQSQENEAQSNSSGMNTAMPKYPQYATWTAIVGSFSGWPDKASHTPQELAEAGFFYADAGMKYMRDSGIVHRDIKPGNLLRYIGDDGRSIYKLTDFGAAKQLDLEEEQFMSLYGIEEYLRPYMFEKAVLRNPNHPQFTATEDLLSKVMTFFHVATGQLPFKPFGGRQNRQTICYYEEANFWMTMMKTSDMCFGLLLAYMEVCGLFYLAMVGSSYFGSYNLLRNMIQTGYLTLSMRYCLDTATTAATAVMMVLREWMKLKERGIKQTKGLLRSFKNSVGVGLSE